MLDEESTDAVSALHDLSATDLIAGFRARQFSPSDVLDDVLAHIAVWEPHIKALYAFDPEGARAAAKASTERWQKGEAHGALDGVPVTIKDNIATKGVPVPLGSATMKLVPAEADAPPAARHHFFHEVKTLVVFDFDKNGAALRKAYHATQDRVDDFREKVTSEALKRGAARAKDLVFLGDGAP